MEEKYSQRMEINISDMEAVVKALMRAGYQVLCSQDGESTDIVIIEYLCPASSGHRFEETEG